MIYRKRTKPKKEWTVNGHIARSGYEVKVCKDLAARRIPYSYEPDELEIRLPVIGGACTACGAVKGAICKHAKYCIDLRFDSTPDVRYCELKGRLTSKDRTRLKAVYRAWGDKFKLYLLFQRDNKISKSSTTTYTMWARSNGFVCAVGNSVPDEWLR